MFKNKKILLGVSGGIAAYKSCELLRRFQDLGATVHVAMTKAAQEFVGKQTFQALSGHSVYDQIFSEKEGIEHTELSLVDLFIVAPCSANTLAKLAHGLADDPVSLSFLAAQCPKIIVPSMNVRMFQNPIVQKNLEELHKGGVLVAEPDEGYLACGEIGSGRFPETSQIISVAKKALELQHKKNENAVKVLITAGRTEEPIDPVRYISNKSSGKTALRIAESFLQAGDHITIISGPVDVQYPDHANVIYVQTAEEMHQKVIEFKNDQDAFVMIAAVADYRPKKMFSEKIKGSRAINSIELVANPDILAEISACKSSKQVVAGFALETANPIENGIQKLQQKKCDIMVLNTPVRADSGFGKDEVEAVILNPNSTKETSKLKRIAKTTLAQDLVQKIHDLILNGAK